MYKKFSTIVISILFFSFSSVAQPQKDTTINLILNIKMVVNHLHEEIMNSDGLNLRSRVKKLKDIVDNYYDKYSILCQKDSLFEKSLSLVYKILWHSIGNIKGEVIEDVIEELEAKNTVLNQQSSLEKVPKIQVEVTTVDTINNPVTGYYVYWNYWLDKDNNNPAANFNNPTNPVASGYLLPGTYDIWVSKINKSTRFPPKSKNIKSLIINSKNKTSITIIVSE